MNTRRCGLNSPEGSEWVSHVCTPWLQPDGLQSDGKEAVFRRFLESLSQEELERRVQRAWTKWDNSYLQQHPPPARAIEEREVVSAMWRRVEAICEKGDIASELRSVFGQRISSPARGEATQIYIKSYIRWAYKALGGEDLDVLSGTPATLLKTCIDKVGNMAPDDQSRGLSQESKQMRAWKILTELTNRYRLDREPQQKKIQKTTR